MGIGLIAIGWGIVGAMMYVRKATKVQSDAIGDILFGFPLGIVIGLTIGMVYTWTSL